MAKIAMIEDIGFRFNPTKSNLRHPFRPFLVFPRTDA